MSEPRSSWPPVPSAVPEITVQQLKEMQQSGAKLFLLDVRQPWENQQAQLPDSVLEPLNRLASNLDGLRPQVPKGATVVVYCHHGMRSQVGADILIKAGFKNVVSLKGGIDAYSALIDPSVPRY
jgi:adenylyltransferase/sulfurtransferase